MHTCIYIYIYIYISTHTLSITVSLSTPKPAPRLAAPVFKLPYPDSLETPEKRKKRRTPGNARHNRGARHVYSLFMLCKDERGTKKCVRLCGQKGKRESKTLCKKR